MSEEKTGGSNLIAIMEFVERAGEIVDDLKKHIPVLKHVEQEEAKTLIKPGEFIMYLGNFNAQKVFIYMNAGEKAGTDQAPEIAIKRQLKKWDLFELMTAPQDGEEVSEEIKSILSFLKKSSVIIEKGKALLPELKKLEAFENKKLPAGEFIVYTGQLTEKRIFVYMNAAVKGGTSENPQVIVKRQLKRWDLVDLMDNIGQYLPK